MTQLFTVEELQRFQQQGTLESHLLSNGMLPLQVLDFVLENNNSVQGMLEAEIHALEQELSALEYENEDLRDELRDKYSV